MIMDYIENIIQLGTIFVLLLLCLFGYIESRRKIWLHASIFFLGDLLSSYFWTAYSMPYQRHTDYDRGEKNESVYDAGNSEESGGSSS